MADRTERQQLLFEQARSRQLRQSSNTTSKKSVPSKSDDEKKKSDTRGWYRRLVDGLGGKG